MIIGYARVSTDGQSVAAQERQLTEAGAAKVFLEKASGAKSNNRPQLHKALAKLAPGDVLLVTRLDRLARSTRDLLFILDDITAKEARFRSLAETWADTTTPHGLLMVTMLAGFAEFERGLIVARTSEGRKRAMRDGVKFGAKSKLTPYQKQEARGRVAKGKESIGAIARSYDVSRWTIQRLAP